MFSNQITTRDLYSTNDNMEKSYSIERDFSQLQNAQFTQFDSSQCSQDFFSQTQCSNGSAESQGRRFQAFEKYMAKPSLFRSNSHSQGRASQNRLGPSTSQSSSREPQQTMKQQISFQQQLNINKNKAKERDERDMLSSIVHIVKECSDEVKSSLHILRDGESENTDKLKTTLVSLTEQIKESSDRILKSVQSREEQTNMVGRLQRQLLEKEERIQELLNQQNNNSIQETSRSSVDAMKSFMADQHAQTDKRLQKLLDATQDQLKLLKDQMSAQRTSSDENNKSLQDMKYTTNRQIQDLEKRVVDELLHIRDDFEQQKRDMESFYKNQLQLLQQKQTRELTQHLDRGFENISKANTDFDLLERHTEMVTEVFKTQQKDIVSAVKTAVVDQSKQYLRQNQQLLSSHEKMITHDLNQKLDSLKTSNEAGLEVIAEHINKSFDDKSAAWKNEMVPKKVQAQLNELHSQHLSEIQRLEKQIEEQRRKAEEIAKGTAELHAVAEKSVLQNVYDLQAEDKQENKNKPPGSLFQRASGFVSPRPLVGTSWNSRAIFGRTNPSPVATVLPQRQSVTHDDVNSVTNAVSSFPQQSRRNQQNQMPPLHVETPDHVVPATPESTREITEESLTTVTDIESSQAALKDDISQVLSMAEVQGRNRKKAGPKKRGRKRKKKVVAKKPKTKQETYEQHQRITDTKNSVIKNTRASAVFDFTDEMSPQPLLRKTSTLKQVVPKTTSSSGQSSTSNRFYTESSPSTTDSQASVRALPHIDVFMKRKVGLADRVSPVKHANENPEKQNPLCMEDFLSTPNMTANKNDASVLKKVGPDTKTVGAEGINKNIRRFEPKRKLCDFDYEIVNLLECIQKKKKINV